MKFLCLHGAYGSAKAFQTQLAPFVSVIESSKSSAFKWIDGGHPAEPPDGFQGFFGPPPWRRFINFDGMSALDDMLDKIRDFPDGLCAEDAMRALTGSELVYQAEAIRSTLAYLFKIIDDDPEIDGILGYSEGATMAGTLILEERRRWEEEGIPRRIKCGVFFAGWPPMKLGQDGSVECLLADECEDVIDVPTCHIVGCNDPYIHGSMALYAMCDGDVATLFDHGKGHTVPRDSKTIMELAAAIRDSVSKVQAAA